MIPVQLSPIPVQSSSRKTAWIVTASIIIIIIVGAIAFAYFKPMQDQKKSSDNQAQSDQSGPVTFKAPLTIIVKPANASQDAATSSGSVGVSQKTVLNQDEEQIITFVKGVKAATTAKDLKAIVAILRNGIPESGRADFDKKVASMTQDDINGLWDGMNYLYGNIDPAILETDATTWKINGDTADVIISTYSSGSSKSTWTIHFKKVEGNWTTA